MKHHLNPRLRQAACHAAVLALLGMSTHRLAGQEQVPSVSEAKAEMKRLGGKFLAPGYKSSWSPDGTRLVFGKVSDGLQIMDLTSGKVTDLVDSGKDPAWSAKDVIAYVRGDREQEEVWLVHSDGSKAKKLHDGGVPVWSKRGTTLFFHSRKEGKILLILLRYYGGWTMACSVATVWRHRGQ